MLRKRSKFTASMSAGCNVHAHRSIRAPERGELESAITRGVTGTRPYVYYDAERMRYAGMIYNEGRLTDRGIYDWADYGGDHVYTTGDSRDIGEIISCGTPYIKYGHNHYPYVSEFPAVFKGKGRLDPSGSLVRIMVLMDDDVHDDWGGTTGWFWAALRGKTIRNINVQKEWRMKGLVCGVSIRLACAIAICDNWTDDIRYNGEVVRRAWRLKAEDDILFEKGYVDKLLWSEHFISGAFTKLRNYTEMVDASGEAAAIYTLSNTRNPRDFYKKVMNDLVYSAMPINSVHGRYADHVYELDELRKKNCFLGFELAYKYSDDFFMHWTTPESADINADWMFYTKPGNIWWRGIDYPTNHWVKLGSWALRQVALVGKETLMDLRLQMVESIVGKGNVRRGREVLCYVRSGSKSWIPVDVSGHMIDWLLLSEGPFYPRNFTHLIECARRGKYQEQDYAYHTKAEVLIGIMVYQKITGNDNMWVQETLDYLEIVEPYKSFTDGIRFEIKSFGNFGTDQDVRQFDRKVLLMWLWECGMNQISEIREYPDYEKSYAFKPQGEYTGVPPVFGRSFTPILYEDPTVSVKLGEPSTRVDSLQQAMMLKRKVQWGMKYMDRYKNWKTMLQPVQK